MNKKEKYINYVVKDILKNTKMDEVTMHGGLVQLPFIDVNTWISFGEFVPTNMYPSRKKRLFNNHISERYGVNEREYEIMWEMYMEQLQGLINNYLK
tara:strand:- start:403 stop:693 length:291 start_codon:yes stop_codon:yes gene_type:complete